MWCIFTSLLPFCILFFLLKGLLKFGALKNGLLPFLWILTDLCMFLPAMQETPVQFWGGKIHWRRDRLPTLVFWPGEFHGQFSSIASGFFTSWATKEALNGLTGSQRVRHDWVTFTFTFCVWIIVLNQICLFHTFSFSLWLVFSLSWYCFHRARWVHLVKSSLSIISSMDHAIGIMLSLYPKSPRFSFRSSLAFYFTSGWMVHLEMIFMKSFVKLWI